MNNSEAPWWPADCGACPHERIHRVEYEQLTRNLEEVKDRVGKVEATLSRGILLLVANLAGVAMTLLRAYLDS